jgi:hypothetical protein
MPARSLAGASAWYDAESHGDLRMNLVKPSAAEGYPAVAAAWTCSRQAVLLALCAYLLFAHGCHGAGDDELLNVARTLRVRETTSHGMSLPPWPDRKGEAS